MRREQMTGKKLARQRKFADVLPLDPRDPVIMHAKELTRGSRRVATAPRRERGIRHRIPKGRTSPGGGAHGPGRRAARCPLPDAEHDVTHVDPLPGETVEQGAAQQKMLTPPGPINRPMMVRTMPYSTTPRSRVTIPPITQIAAMIHRIVATPPPRSSRR